MSSYPDCHTVENQDKLDYPDYYPRWNQDKKAEN